MPATKEIIPSKRCGIRHDETARGLGTVPRRFKISQGHLSLSQIQSPPVKFRGYLQKQTRRVRGGERAVLWLCCSINFVDFLVIVNDRLIDGRARIDGGKQHRVR